ncbi:MAG TPA: DUF2252 domain-containing protein [Actinomycetota bacterium]|nr:DUF2252 domain-containing protein [Actinomycetota bacterium]
MERALIMTSIEVPSSAAEVQAFFGTSRPSRRKWRALGRKIRKDVPHESLAELPSERGDALALLARQERDRVPSLISLRRERMSANQFAFLRGAALVMADDLSRTPQSGITVQLCGDAHVANFGLFASPERSLVFDLNDFDETLPGPFEWDVKRMAASLVAAGQVNSHKDKQSRKAARAAVRTYRETMQVLCRMPTLDVWYAALSFDDLLAAVRKTPLGKSVAAAGRKAGKRTGDSAVAKLTEVVDGARRFLPDPPLLVPVPDEDRDQVQGDLAEIYAQYLATLAPDRIALLLRYSFADLAHKVVGVGSVGTLAAVVLLESGDKEPLILQVKQATQSVLEPYLAPSQFSEAGKRVVVGQRVLQTVGDPFLGWCHSFGEQPFDFYVRQLRDMKGSIDTAGLTPDALQVYAQVCGAVLARAHARGGSAALIAGYLGDDETFDDAITDFATGYASLNEHDLASLRAAMV